MSQDNEVKRKVSIAHLSAVKKYYAKNGDDIRRLRRERYQRNKEAEKAKARARYQRNRETARAKALERYHRKKAEAAEAAETTTADPE